MMMMMMMMMMNVNDIKRSKDIIFRSTGFDDWFVGLERYSKFAPKQF